MKRLPDELEEARKKIESVAKSYQLDFFETIFELVTYDQINQFAAYGGFPVRYPHWRFGMEYEKLSKSYEYGLSKIYEMVLNTDPCYAYLMEGNRTIDQKLVMAHVYGHCDFFKNNQWFAPTNRKMMDVMANHATRVRRYIDRHGLEKVESFIDCVLSLENLIDRHSPYIKKHSLQERVDEENRSESRGFFNFERDYMSEYVNEDLQRQVESQEEDDAQSERLEKPERDVLAFLMHHAPLKNWQQDIIGIIRDEAYYFAPQGMTKIMNEGWASYWHSKIMTQDIMNDMEVVDFADAHSGTMAMSPMGFNPYKVGIELLRDIEERWNKGQFGEEWNQCRDIKERVNWDRKLNLGREKIFEVRQTYNDVTFIEDFLTEEFCVKNKMFVYKYNQRTEQFEVDTRNFPAIKKQLLFQLTNFGQPIIQVESANFENRGELLMTHLFEGIELQPDYMQQALLNLFRIWRRPVNLVTVLDKTQALVRCDNEGVKVHKKA